jgi:type 1 glutamine amidotransferase
MHSIAIQGLRKLALVAVLTGAACTATPASSIDGGGTGGDRVTPPSGSGGTSAGSGGTTGSGGTIGGGGSGGAVVDAGGTDGAVADGATPTDAPRSAKILIYGVTGSGYRHASIPAAANAIAAAAAAVGLTAEMVGVSDRTNMVDPSKFTAAALAGYGAVILLANDAEPFGYPATDEIQNLAAYVQGGGALVGIECVTNCYGGAVGSPGTAGHPKSMPFHALLGATFQDHPGNFAPATCTKVGTHAVTAQLAPSFRTTDEIYSFTDFRMDNQVILSCVSSTAPSTVRPVSWVREEGAGRVFYSALGHADTHWTMPLDPANASRLVDDLVLPGLLWSMKRGP